VKILSLRGSFTFIALLLVYPVLAQVGNEWINVSQQYFKIPVAKNGLYRVTYSNLQIAGLPPSVDPKTFQLFHRGVEQAIYVAGENDGQFNAVDYLEFFGRSNDGTPDTELYDDPVHQPHKLYNLYSDTTSYFLTFGAVTGKRMSVLSDVNSGLPVSPYHLDEKLLVLSDQYSTGIDYGDIQKSVFEEGEGWTGTQILQGQIGSYALQGITKTVTTAGAPTIEILLTGRGPMNHAVEIYAGSRFLTVLNFTGYQSFKHQQALLWGDVGGDGKVTIGIKVVGVSGQPDRVSVGYISLHYPQETDMMLASEKAFIFEKTSANKSYAEIKNPAPATRLFDITDRANTALIATTQTTTLNAIFATATSRVLWATNTNLIPTIKRVSFRSINPTAHNYIVITHPSLRKATAGYTDPVKAYAEYRALPAGGNYDTLVVNIDQLYNQFNYGEQSPLAIYHFMKYMTSAKVPAYLFLIGKGLEVNWRYYRNQGAFPLYKDLVPTAGFPASDMLFTAGLSGNDGMPAVSTGRLTAVSPEDVASYFNKVKETEALPFDNLRRKNILHLSGGLYPGEPQIFRSYLEQFAGIAESYHLGGHIQSIAKQSTDIEIINAAEEVNKGLNMITFFGHSAPQSTDFDIGFVTDPVMGYNNKGKYPMILMNGCSAGSFFLNASIFGENWINTSNKGAIGVIAHSSFGFAYTLKNYSSLFYEVAFADSVFIRKGLGDVQREVARRYLLAYDRTPASITQVQEMILLGDPAVRLFGASKPDYEIQANNISVKSFTGETITALTDSFQLKIVVRNFGVAENKKMRIAVTQTLQDNSKVRYDSIVEGVLYSDTLAFTIRGNSEKGFGNNLFAVNVDADNSIDELSEDNNGTSIAYFIPVSRTKNIFPDKYAIVNSRALNLSVQHTNMLSMERTFLLELDTTMSFNSGFRQQFKIKGTVLATQPIDLLSGDTVVYYWRTRLADSLANESLQWDVSSFTYINNGPEGWAQIDFPQYSDNPSVGLVKDPLLERLHFEETVTSIAIRTFGSAAGKAVDSVSFKINGAEFNTYTDLGGAFGCRNNTINLIAFDKKTTQPYVGVFLNFVEIAAIGGNKIICGREPYVINSYTPQELTMGKNVDIIRYVNNIVAGDSVILFNIGDAGYSQWPLAAKTKLGELGISVAQINALQPGEPIIIFGKKGSAPGAAKLLKTASGPASTQPLKFNGTVTGRFNSGTMNSTVVGPAQRWDKLFVRYSDVGATDDLSFDVVGIKLTGEEQLLRTGLKKTEDLSTISVKEYPYLKISFKVADQVLLTSPQLNHWIVTYEPVAEGLLLYKGQHEPQTVNEGQHWQGNYSFINISNKLFEDSLTVKYDVQGTGTFTSTRRSMMIQAPKPADTTNFTIPFETIGQGGVNNVGAFVNPYVLSERSYDNNVIVLDNYLTVITDTTDPVLDVTVDDRHIENEEFVSSSPDIRIMLWDNNPYLLKKDTTGVTMFMAYPCDQEECDFKQIYFSGNQISWKGETEGSEFLVNFTPGKLPEGKYTLRVEAHDAHGNASGVEPYQISFQVKTETNIFVSSPYPNPFNYKTNFVFSITGDELPMGLMLQIFNLNGSLVQEFSEYDGNKLHIGTNTISWSATDPTGNSLPNGIYFYRLNIQMKDHSVGANGKVVLLR
jgi:hypothetical protein